MRKVTAAFIVATVFFSILSITSCTKRNDGGGARAADTLTLTVLTHRTDRLANGGDGSLEAMTKAFEAANNCRVAYQGYTDYASDVATMMNTKDYGDVLMIVDSVKIADLGVFFEPLGTFEELNEKYLWADVKMYQGAVYGLAHMGTVSGGVCYNKKVWADAGIAKLPSTPEEFLADLQQIKNNIPNVIPYYTNYNSRWTQVQWASLVVSASGNPNYENEILINKKPIFEKGGAYYNVWKLLFDVYRNPALHEPDPMTDDWEGCKAAINDGRIATMVMGSWAVSQFKEAGPNPQDIGYMPAPFSVNGKQYAQSTSDYCMGVNKNSSAALKELGKKYITWFIEESGFAQKEGGLSALRGSPTPDYLEAFANAELFIAQSAPEPLVGVWDDIAKVSEVNPWGDESGNFKFQIGDAAFAGRDESVFDSIVNAQNEKWAKARDANAALAAYLAN
ncbi:MAG: ABC transporter substrate-binding protein [Treponema sp.]|nr:ABC transporter substrate-binding protein [Treponema sp.]